MQSLAVEGENTKIQTLTKTWVFIKHTYVCVNIAVIQESGPPVCDPVHLLYQSVYQAIRMLQLGI